MKDLPWPYRLPIWRSRHRAVSPDGRFVAEIDPAHEVSMGNPTVGTLRLSRILELEHCNPSFVWSSDSRYLAVPQFFHRLGLLRRQRLVVVDVQNRRLFAPRESTYYFQPESFEGGRLVVTKNPFRSPSTVEFRLPDDIGRFAPVEGRWQTP